MAAPVDANPRAATPFLPVLSHSDRLPAAAFARRRIGCGTRLGNTGKQLAACAPYEGGQGLRAPIASRTDYVRATDIAASVGQAVALAFG